MSIAVRTPEGMAYCPHVPIGDLLLPDVQLSLNELIERTFRVPRDDQGPHVHLVNEADCELTAEGVPERFWLRIHVLPDETLAFIECPACYESFRNRPDPTTFDRHDPRFAEYLWGWSLA